MATLQVLSVAGLIGGALAAGWWLGTETGAPPAAEPTVIVETEPLVAPAVVMEAAASPPGEEDEHAVDNGAGIADYCAQAWSSGTDQYRACLGAEEAARFELVAMCGTEELMAEWRRCARSSPSFAVQRHCMKGKLDFFDKRRDDLANAGLELVATAEVSGEDGLTVWPKSKKKLESLSQAVFAIAAGDGIAHVGASRPPLAQTLRRWRQTVNTGLRGGRSLKASFDLTSWTDTLIEHGTLEIYAREGETVETKAGRFNAYNAEAAHLADALGGSIATVVE